MYLYRYRKQPNFGDELNDYLWPRFIRAALEREAGSEEIIVGIGTLLNERLPTSGTLHILGAGLGYGTVPAGAMRNWEIHFVRGPLTARALHLDPKLGISDPGILLHRTEYMNRKKDINCAFMPHHSLYSQRMQTLCEQASVHFIDPEAPCETVIDQIGRSRKLICSAMHGAITAEALRVPWMPAITSHEILESKWHDWAASMETDIQFRKLPTIWGQPQPSLRGRLTARLKASAFSRRLARMAKSTRFQLGSDSILEDRLRRIEARIQDFNASLPG